MINLFIFLYLRISYCVQWNAFISTFISLLTLPNIAPKWLLPISCLSLFLITHWIPLVLAVCAWLWGHSWLHGTPSSGHILTKNDSPSAEMVDANSSSVRAWVWRTSTSLTLELWMTWSCIGFVQVATAAVRLWLQQSCHDQKIVFPQHPPHSSAFPCFLPAFHDSA